MIVISLDVRITAKRSTLSEFIFLIYIIEYNLFFMLNMLLIKIDEIDKIHKTRKQLIEHNGGRTKR